MRRNNQTEHDTVENDPVWDLLSKDASTHPVTTSPWFAQRTAALAEPGKNPLTSILRWLIPVPIAAFASFAALAALMAFNHGGIGRFGTYVSTEAEFEQHMELLFASGE
jgi:hypothetical protein